MVGGTSDVEYMATCHQAMAEQLAASHIQNEACQRRVVEVYCSKLLSVERPTPFVNRCPLNEAHMLSPAHEVEGHLPAIDADNDAEYRGGEETTLTLAVLVLVFYHGLADLVKRLVLDLWTERHSFLLHVDPKADVGLEDNLKKWVAGDIRLKQNVHVRSEVNVTRSGESLLRAELYGLRELLRMSPDWNYFVLLSDSDQLVRPLKFLERHLGLHWGESFVNTEVLSGRPKSIAVECVGDRVHSVRMGGHEKQVPTRPGLSLASGSQFVVLFREFAELAVQALVDSQSFAREVLDEVSFFSSPDETFFQTLAVHSSLCVKHNRYNFHFHDTQGNLLDESSRRYTDFPTGSPPILGDSQLPLLLSVRSQQPLMFARKFDGANSSSVALLAHVRSLSLPPRLVWTSFVGGSAWSQAAVAALLPRHCWESVGVDGASSIATVYVGDAVQANWQATVLQIENRRVSIPMSTYEASPALYSFQVRGIVAECFAKGGWGLAGAASRPPMRAHGTIHLEERFAVPRYTWPGGAGPTRGSTALSPLIWMRVGAGWNPNELSFQGTSSIIGSAQVSAFGLSAILHWRPAQVVRRLRLRWTSPSGTFVETEETMDAWTLLTRSAAPLGGNIASAPELGWWRLEAMLEGIGDASRSDRVALVGARRFFVFGVGTPPPMEAFELFFRAVPAPPEVAPIAT